MERKSRGAESSLNISILTALFWRDLSDALCFGGRQPRNASTSTARYLLRGK